MDLPTVRARLEKIAYEVVQENDIGAGQVYVGSRTVEFQEPAGEVWNFGITVSIPHGFDQALPDFDGLMAGPRPLKDAIEEDRSLGGAVMDLDVKAIRGPQRSRDDDVTVTEWIVQIRAEE
jgi:hypothetical protein